jgi:opacity protein-like surface antigen
MRTIKVTLIAAAFSLLGVQGASAQNIYVGVQGGLNLTFESEIDGFDALTYDPGFVVSGVVGYKIIPNVRLEGELAYRLNDLDEIVGFPIPGDMSSLAVMGNVFYDFTTGSPLTPYIGGGLGVANVEIDFDVPGGKDDDTVFAYQVALGAAYELSPAAALTLDLRYFGTENADLFGAEFTYDNMSFMAGLRYSF